MNKITKLAIVTIAALCSAAQTSSNTNKELVYCQAQGTGYSLFRMSDNKGIGLASFSDQYECTQAADLANEVAQDIACSPYINESSNYHGYSAYRISDGADLGDMIYGIFQGCQSDISHARNGSVCLVFTVEESLPLYARYNIASGEVEGDVIYDNPEDCWDSY